MLEQYGIRWQGTRPLTRLRKGHEVMRTFLAEGRTDFRGGFYRYSGLFTAARPVQQRLTRRAGGGRIGRLQPATAPGITCGPVSPTHRT